MLKDPLVKYGLLALALLVAVVAAWWVLTEPGRQAQKAADAKGGQVVAESGARVSEAVAGKSAELAENQAARTELGRETEDAILNHPAAGTRLDNDLHRLALERLCLRQANRAKPACVQLRQAGPAAP